MTQLGKIFQWQTNSGHAVTIGQVSVTPQSQALIIRSPYGGWVWNRPVAVLVKQGGQTKRVPIVDVTRLVQVGLLGLSVACTVIALIRIGKDRRT